MTGQIYHLKENNLNIRIVDESDGVLTYLILNSRNQLDFRKMPEKELERMAFVNEEDQRAVRLADPDQFVDWDSLPEKARKQAENRYDLVTGFLENNRKALFDGQKKVEAIRIFLENSGRNISEKTFRRWLQMFFARGMRKESMVSGSYLKKPSRKSAAVRPGTSSGKGGSKPSGFYEPVFRVYYRNFYCTEKRPSAAKVYRRMLRENFTDQDNYLEKEHPSYYMWLSYIKSQDWRETYESRWGARKYKLLHKLLTGSDREIAEGFMDVVQVDSTVLDIEAVAEGNPALRIGRPVLFLAVDTTTKLILGFVVSLENASYRTLGDLLLSVAEDKAELGRKLGAEISESDWPVSDCQPNMILADNAECESSYSDELCDKLGIGLVNARSYLASDKGSVERRFRTINETIKQALSGAVRKDYLQRGEEPPKKKAKLTLSEIQRVVFETVVMLNNKTIDKFTRTREEAANGINPVPADLAEFYRSTGRDFSAQVGADFKRLVLPSKECSVRTGGDVWLHKLQYTGRTASDRNFLDLHRGSRFMIYYDERDVSMIWLYDDEMDCLRELILCGVSKTYLGTSLVEYRAVSANMNRTEKEQIKRQFDCEERLDDLTDSLEAIPAYDFDNSNNIRENREKEKQKSRPLDRSSFLEELNIGWNLGNDAFGFAAQAACS